MSIQLLRDKVYEICEKKLAEFDKVEDASMARIHKEIRKGFALELNMIINSFVLELSKCSSLKKKEEIASNYKEQFASKEFKAIFKEDMYYSDEYKRKCIKNCDITDTRTTKGFLFEKETKDEKSYDFYCVYVGKLGWNGWLEEFSPADIIISAEHNNTDNSIVYRYEIRNLPKELNSIPFLEIENYVPRLTILEEILNLFKQKNRKINITGISGIGKTLLAKHFLQHYFEDFSHIVWLNCSSGILNAFTSSNGIALIDTMGMIVEYNSYLEGKMNAEGIMSILLGRLKNVKNNCIIVLDNIDEDIYNYAFNLPTNWKILTTSQKKLEGFYNYTSPNFEEKATALFYKYYTLEKDDESLIRLLSTIEYHTLTVELLAKTAEQRQITIIDLLKRFTESGINVVEKAIIRSEHSNERRQTIENIENYLNIIFDTSNLSDEEFKIILNLAIMQDEAISIELFVDVYLSGGENKKEVDTLYGDINILSNKGWINKENNEILLHNLIKEIFLKNHINYETFFKPTIDYLLSCLQVDNFTNTIKYFSLLENFLKNIQSDALIKHMVEPMSDFYNLLGLHHKSLELYSAYFPLDIKSLDFKNLNNYAYRYRCMGNYYNALECYYKIYNHFASQNPRMDYMFAYFESFCNNERESNTIENEGKLLDIMSNLLLGLILFVENKYHISEVYINEITLNKRKKAILFLTDALNQEKTLIKGIELYISKVGENEAFSQENLKRCKNTYSSINTCLGTLYLSLKDYERAFFFFEESIKNIEQLYGQYSYHLLQNYRILFDFFLGKNDSVNAAAYLDKYTFICERFPVNHPEKVYQKKMEAKLYLLNNSLSKRKTNKLIKSVEEIINREIKHRLKIAIKVLDYVKDKGDEIVEIYKISWINYVLSVDLYINEITFITLSLFHEDSENTFEHLIRYLGIVSLTYAEFKNYNEAIRYLTLSIEYTKKHFPEDLMNSSISNIALAQLYISNGDFELAEQYNKSGIEGLMDILANNSKHIDKQMIKNSLKIAFESQDKIEKELKNYIKN